MDSSFKQLKLVPDQLLEERIEFVQKLQENDTEAYEIIKDKLTGEHYLHYYYLQINLSGDGEKEVYNHLLPLENDDVLTLLFEKPDFSYPEQWKEPYLRNGPNGQYVWFDPGYKDDFEESVQLANEIKEKLELFKTQGDFNQESMEKFLKDLDQLRDKS